jgi:undecaprenyl-diphosphatase
MQVLAILGSGCVVFLLGAAAYFTLRRARSGLARPIPTIAGGAFSLYTLTHWLAARPRPSGHGYGFPSGHAMGATVFFGWVVWMAWRSGTGRRWCWTVTTVACALVFGIAYCRLYLNVHWLTDVVGGFTGGLACLMAVLLVFDRRRAAD